MSLIDDHVERFNEGVRTGNWAPMAENLAGDAVMEFVGIPIGPFRGRDAIAEAYRTQPPDDELVVLERRGEGSVVYAWAGRPARPAGELHVTERDGRIASLRVLYETFS